MLRDFYARKPINKRGDEMPDVRTDELKERVNDIFREVFDDDSIRITEETAAKDVEGWDSLTHVNLIIAVEKKFKVSFSTKEVVALRNVGDFLRLIEKKTGR